jgi:phosphomannomutase
VIRVYAEASSRDRAEQFAERLVSVIEGAR